MFTLAELKRLETMRQEAIEIYRHQPTSPSEGECAARCVIAKIELCLWWNSLRKDVPQVPPCPVCGE